jgi:hypothetical protein
MSTKRSLSRLVSASASVPILIGTLMSDRAWGQSMADFWAGRASFIVDNQFYGTNGMHFISDVMHNGQYYVYGIVGTPRGLGVGLWRSTNMTSFTFDRVVVAPGGAPWMSRMASFPGVLKDGNNWYMVFEGAGGSPGDIGLATSSDGVRWNVDPNRILVRQPGGWESSNIGTPWLTKVGGQFLLYYHGFGSRRGSPSPDCQVGAAVGTNLRQLQRVSPNPLIPTQNDTWDTGTIGKRDIIFENGFYYMVVEISGEQPYESTRWTTGIWRSQSLLGPWERSTRNPVLPVTASGFGFDGPDWVRTPDGKLHIYFRHPQGPTARATLRWSHVDPPAAWTFQAEDSPHQTGRREGAFWMCNQAEHNAGFAVFGPYTRAIQPGWRVATWRMAMADRSGPNEVVATIDVVNADTGQPLGGVRPIRRSEFAANTQFQDFEIAFIAPANQRLEFRTYFHDRGTLRIDWVKVR